MSNGQLLPGLRRPGSPDARDLFRAECVKNVKTQHFQMSKKIGRLRLDGGSGRVERTEGDVVPVGIPERKLRGSGAGIHVRLFFQGADERARPRQRFVEVVDPEEQEEAVSRFGVGGTCQRRMLVGAPLVETEQYRSIRVEDLPEVVVGRSRLRQAKQRLVPLEAPGHVSHANDRPRALHSSLFGYRSTSAPAGE